MNKLAGSRAYIGGSMDRVADGGVGWRNWIIPKLHQLKIVVLNPCDKPIDIGDESIENRQYRQQLIDDKNYDKMSQQMKTIRSVDLRMVDLSDFLIVNFDTDQQLCGTLEEVFWANRLKRPILLYCPRGINKIYHWMWGVLPHQLFFEQWDDLFSYLNDIDSGKNTEHLKRWMWFDYDKLTPQLTPPKPTCKQECKPYGPTQMNRTSASDYPPHY